MEAFREVREWGIGCLVENLRNEPAKNGGAVSVVELFPSLVLRTVLSMCYGSKLNEETVVSVQGVLRELLLPAGGLDENLAILGFFFRWRRARMAEIRRRQREAPLPLINNRRNVLPPAGGAYVDMLLTLTVDGSRNLNDDELVTLCSEFITGGTDTTSTSVQWLMANLVIRQDAQARLYDEILGVTGRGKSVEENDLERMPYLEAIVKETLRRHLPGHFVLNHAVTQPCKLSGYNVPANAFVNFFLLGMAMDPAVWENPSDFRLERFADEGVEMDLTGTKEIKMMPFGAGRRVCPVLGMAMLHLNLIVPRLVQEFSWECKPGATVDLCETQEFTTVMKYLCRRSLRRGESHKDTSRRLGGVIRNLRIGFFWNQAGLMDNEADDHRLCGFEIVFPAMLNEAKRLGLDFPYELPFTEHIVTSGRLGLKLPNHYPLDLFESLWVIDTVERLGIDRQFKREIKESLDYEYSYWDKRGIG